jgi:tRNA 2-thiouridine synthesizing protein A
MTGEVRLVDARGLLCPWPALRLSRAAREAGGRGLIRILADDPVAPRELAILCRERGWGFSPDPDDKDAFEVEIV